MAYGLQLLTPPSGDALDLDKVRRFLRQDIKDDDGTIADLIAAAVSRAERVSDRQLLTATWQLVLPGFPIGAFPFQGWYPYNPTRYGWGIARGATSPPPDLFPNALRLPKSPLQTVWSVQYYGLSGMLNTVDPTTYRVIGSLEPAILTPAFGTFWPIDVALVPDAVKVTYTAGYGGMADIPGDIRGALMRCVAHEYEMREKADEEYLDRLFVPFNYGGCG